ncbi:MAG: ThuA domain-containing protein [Planctomycetes bacterium]|nr:ThuA domain-containing protein [Planctomycetota bacterium]
MNRLFLPALVCLATAIAACAGQKVADPKMVEKVEKALPEKAPAKPKATRNILVFSKTAGFRHSSIELGTKAIVLMGDKTGAYTVTATEDESFLEPEKLAKFDAVFMLNTTENCFRPKIANKEEADKREELLKKSLEDFVASGKGLIGVHSATDTYKKWDAYNKMMGGAFVSHPWHKKVPVKVVDPKSPVTAVFDGKDFEIADEIYMFRDDTALAKDRRYLLVMDIEKMDEKDKAGGKRKDGTYPISWINTYGKGRCFYCSLGHREEIFWNPTILQYYLAGIQYALGDLEADATPASK